MNFQVVVTLVAGRSAVKSLRELGKPGNHKDSESIALDRL